MPIWTYCLNVEYFLQKDSINTNTCLKSSSHLPLFENLTSDNDNKRFRIRRHIYVEPIIAKLER